MEVIPSVSVGLTRREGEGDLVVEFNACGGTCDETKAEGGQEGNLCFGGQI